MTTNFISGAEVYRTPVVVRRPKVIVEEPKKKEVVVTPIVERRQKVEFIKPVVKTVLKA